MQAHANLDFPVGSTTIQPTYRNNLAEIARIQKDIQKVLDNPDAQITAIHIHGVASPEGSHSRNGQLSAGRAEAFRKHLIDTYDLPGHLITTSSTPEDWEGFRTILRMTHITGKEQITCIIDSDNDPDAKERTLRSLPQWKTYT